MVRIIGFLALLCGLAASAPSARDARTARTNYLFGNDPRKWVTEVSDSGTQAFPETWPTSALADLAPYSMYIGGVRDIQPLRIATDSQGNVYVAGNLLYGTILTDRIAADVFVMKLDSAGRTLYTTYFGGNTGEQTMLDMAVDTAGRVYLTGITNADDFPTINAIQDRRKGSDAFVTQLSPTGGFLYSTYLGGERQTWGQAITADSAGNAYVTGWTRSPDFPLTAGAFQTRPLKPDSFKSPANAFVSKISPDGKRLIYSTLLGGTQVACSGGSSCIPAAPYDAGQAIAVDESGSVYVAGRTNSIDFPVTADALQTSCGCRWTNGKLFVARLNPAGSSLAFSTYFGGSPILDYYPGGTLTAIAIDRLGAVYLTGSTVSSDFPTTPGAFRRTPDDPLAGGRTLAFASKLAADGRLDYSTLLSGTGQESGNGIKVDAQGNAYVVGNTRNSNFPLTAGAFNRGGDFLTQINPTGSALVFSTLLPSGFARQALALDPSGNVYLLGDTGYLSRLQGPAIRLPTFFGLSNAARDRVTGRIVSGELISLFGSDIGPDRPSGLQLDQSGRVSTTLAGSQVLIGGVASPLLYAQKDQINAVVPLLSLSADVLRPVQVLRNGAVIAEIRLPHAEADPAVFTLPGSDLFALPGINQAAALNEDGTINSLKNPAKFGSIVAIFATGLGPTEPRGEDGVISGDLLPKPRLLVSVGSSSVRQPLEILYAGQAPDLVTGVMQINFRLPPAQAAGTLVLGLSVRDPASGTDFRSPGFLVYAAP